MQTCRVTIATTIDGKTTEIVREGKMSLQEGIARIIYTEENAEITLVFNNREVCIERVGDYTMRLRMKKGEICDGEIGISGSTGRVQTQVTRLAYSLKNDSFMLSLHYDLLLGDAIQKTKIRLFAK